MPNIEPTSTFTHDKPRTPSQEIADLLATALLRLRQSTSPESDTCTPTRPVELGFCGDQSVNGNAPQISGVDL
jgi:hypothetical protein